MTTEVSEPVTHRAGQLLSEAALSATGTLLLDPPDQGQARVRMGADVRLLSAAEYESIWRGFFVLSCLDPEKVRLPQDGRIKVRLGPEGRLYEAAICSAPDVRGPRLAVRVRDLESAVRTLDRLGLVAAQLEQLRTALEREHGLIVLAGLRGSGRTTALHALLSSLAAPQRNIMCAEEEVERLLPGVCHLQCRPWEGLTHAALLKTMRRHDADIYAVGELRDYETLELATQLAVSGRLVIGGLYARDAAHAVARMLNMGIERYQLADVPTTVVAQRLVATDGGRTGRFELLPVSS